MRGCRIITLANQKGGTGKTTSACNLGYALAETGKRVLMVDFDPQSNLSMSFGVERPDELEITAREVVMMIMEDKPLPPADEYILRGEKLCLIPSNTNLYLAEQKFRDEIGGETVLAQLLEPLRSVYDYIIIDTNPYLGLLTINALAASDDVIIPVSPQFWSASGLSDLIRTIFKIKGKINPKINILGILLTMCDERTKIFRDIKALLSEFYGEKVRIFENIIPNTVKIGEANYLSRSILDYDPKGKAAAAYKMFAKEVDDIDEQVQSKA